VEVIMGGKKKTKKKKNKVIHKTLPDLEKSRVGGQVALSGFSYQFLYSCYLILSKGDEEMSFVLEGLEDIDQIKCNVESSTKTHIQLKYSTLKQDASFLKDVLKNFLEVYLLDNERCFKLVYDFNVAKGNFSKLIDSCLDEASIKYWTGIVEKIEQDNNSWNWSGFSIDNFLNNITFEKKKKDDLALEIEKQLIKKYDIVTDNICLYANGIKVYCLEKMECRENVDKKDVDELILKISDDISKGVQNPAHGWIKKVDFTVPGKVDGKSYFEGKKATPQDIACQLPIRRIENEGKIEESIESNKVTVIKASSGQGKTTIALQVAYNLSKNYEVYKLTWCNEVKELDNIVLYFKTRIKLGEKPLILIDNLDLQLSEWNRLAQRLQEEINHNYKVLITSREDDWYNYSGNLSNVKSLRIIELRLEEKDAVSIFSQLKNKHLLHESISDWRDSWGKVENRRLLIEYVYLLTHGEMISERISHQVATISRGENGRVKCEILRIVCFADACGTRVSVMKLIQNIEEETTSDYGELLKSIENEFLISINDGGKYIEGLHPVRSTHIIERLHEYFDINHTAIQVIKLTDSRYLSKLFVNLPKWITNKEETYPTIVNLLWDSKSYEKYVMALKGTFSGTVGLYYTENINAFEDANNHGGLFLISTELNPFTSFIGTDVSLNTLDDMRRSQSDNKNIEYLCNLRDETPKINLIRTDFYFFGKALFDYLAEKDPFIDLESYIFIAYWLLNIDKSYNLARVVKIDEIWRRRDEFCHEVVTDAMYVFSLGNKEKYQLFISNETKAILQYLKESTSSIQVDTDSSENEIHIEYILFPSEVRAGNEESVWRLKTICKALPIYDTYCADAITPQIDALNGYKIPDNAHKTIPFRNIAIMFNQDLASLWNSSIMSNYECSSMLQWVIHWMDVRNLILKLFHTYEIALQKLLEGKNLGKYANQIDDLRENINRALIREIRYPNQERPFEEKVELPGDFTTIRSDYFTSIKNFNNQVVDFMRRDTKGSRLALVNLMMAKSTISKMQSLFRVVIKENELRIDGYDDFCVDEVTGLERLMNLCEYYVEHKPNRHFSKYFVSAWGKKERDKIIANSKTSLSSLEEIYDVDFPVDFYTNGVLKYFPIIIREFDQKDPIEMVKLMYLCEPIVTSDYDYLVVAFCNDKGEIIHNGLKAPFEFLKNFKEAVDNDDDSLMESLSMPFPEEISSGFLNCFDERYVKEPIQQSHYEGIDKVFEVLWSISKTREILTDEADCSYLCDVEEKYKNYVLKTLNQFAGIIPENEFVEISQLCNDVLNGDKFSDVDINHWNERLITMSGLL
jgi:hypothetical protein